MSMITFEIKFATDNPFPTTESMLIETGENLVRVPIESLLNVVRDRYEWKEFWVELETRAGVPLILAQYVADQNNRWCIAFHEGSYPVEHSDEIYCMVFMDHRPNRLLDLIFQSYNV